MRVALGFFVVAVLMLVLGTLLWETPMGKFTLIVGVFTLGIAVLQSMRLRPHPETLGDTDLGFSTLPTVPEIVPLAPILGAIVLVISWVLEIILLLAKYCSAENWPAAEKCWTVTAFTLVATVYHLTIWKRHRGYNYRSPVLTRFQSFAVIVVVCYLAFAAWLLTPLPL